MPFKLYTAVCEYPTILRPVSTLLRPEIRQKPLGSNLNIEMLP